MNVPDPAGWSLHQGPSAEDLIRYLPDLGERTMAQLAELARAPTAERCDRFLSQLDGVRHLVGTLRGSLAREGMGNGRCR